MAIVCHYADLHAFVGIIGNAALWATDFRYLNDSRELRYAWDPFVAKLRRLASEPGEHSETYAAQLKALELMKSIDLMGFDDRMFVACFTQLRDVVSQWSRYSANGHGIALGFDADAIQALRVPIFHCAAGGRLLPAMALVADSVPTDLPDGESPNPPTRQEHRSWGAFLQPVRYGDVERDRPIEAEKAFGDS